MSEAETHEGKAILTRKKGLGRGLDALLGDVLRQAVPLPHAGEAQIEQGSSQNPGNPATMSGLLNIAVADIMPNPDQPRRHFGEDALNELAHSISRHGLIQPIVVRPGSNGYQIVAGERRWRAAQRAQLHQIPAIIRDYSDKEVLEVALLENIQRADLNPIEEAEAYKKLCDEFGHSQAALAQIVDKSRSHVANMMRLLDLPLLLRDLVIEGKLQMGHARALLGSEDAVRLAAIVVKQGLSVRATEALVRNSRKPVKQKTSTNNGGASGNADIRAVETQLSDLLGLTVRIVDKVDGNGGSIIFEYRSLNQLDMLCQRLTGEDF
jgi:ParB family transcriptional regulator, chromosome partitioning protein